METKTCPKCSKDADLSMFIKGRAACRDCRSEYHRRYMLDRIKKDPCFHKKQYEKHKIAILTRSSAWYKSNKQKAYAQSRQRAKNNPDAQARYKMKSQAKCRALLSDGVVRAMINQNNTIDVALISGDLISYKREQIQMLRLQRQLSRLIKEQQNGSK